MMKTKLLLMLLAFGLVAGAAQANLLVNPGFEEGAFAGNAHTPDDWVHYYTSYSIPVHLWVKDTDEAHLGEKYMKMYNWLTAWSSTGWLGQTVPGVKEDGDYTFTVWAKNGAEDQTNLAAIEVEWLGAYDNWISNDFVVIPVTDSDWFEVDFGVFTAPEGVVTATIWLAAPVANGLNAICYDDIVMLGPDPNVYAGPDMISWDGAEVSLTGSESLEGGYSTITWTADPADGAVITDENTLTPTVTINPIIASGPEATIANHSFENGLNNWVVISGETRGTWSGYGWPSLYITPTDGHMCMWQGGVGDEGILSQVLGNVLAANATYTLTVDVVDDGSWPGDAVEYKIQLLAGGTVLAEDDNGHALDDYGVWATSTVTFPTGAAPAQLGEPLEIRLITKDGSSPVNFDNVHLTASPDFPSYVPDLLTYKLRFDIDGKYDVVKIDVYSDACAAWLGVGLRKTTDLVGDDCITDLADLDELLKTWPDHNALTEPTVKEYDEPEPLLRLGSNAKDIAIVNAGFEDPQMDDATYIDYVDGWDPFGGAWYGISNVGVDGGEYWGYDGIAPEGQNIGIIGGGDALDRIEMGMAQILDETLAPDLTYELTVEVGNTPHYDWAGYRVQLLAGGTLIAEDDSTLAPELNTFETSLVMHTSGGASDPNVGELLEIRLIALGFSSGDNYLEVNWDDVQLRAGILFDVNPSPADGGYIEPVSELELSWTNMDPNDPADPVWVDVWFGTDPNDYNDFNKIVDAVENVDSVTVDASTVGETYYWQADSYLYGNPAEVDYNDPADPNSDPDGPPVVEGPLLSFYAAFDVPVSVYAGPDMITWLDQTVSLASTVIDDGKSDLTIEWSADPDVVVFDPDEFVEAPTVTIGQWTYSAANIVNAGFEHVVLADGIMIQAIHGWHRTGGSWIETANPAPTGGDYVCYDGIVPEGDNIASAGAGGGYPPEAGLAQIFLETLAADTEYTLTVEVGNNTIYKDVSFTFGYKVQLLAGGKVLEEDDNSVTVAESTFETSTVTYNSGDNPAQLGEPLEIRLLCLDMDQGTYRDVNFDDVRLTADPPFDPTWSRTVTLTVSAHDDVSSDEDTMTIDMYDSACLATIDLGLAELDIGDLDQDCDTDLGDFAAMAEEWLVYSELTESIEKP